MCRRGLSWPILDALSSGNYTLHLVQNLCSMFSVCWVSKWSWCPGAMRLEADTKKTLYCSCFFNCNFYFYLCIGLHLSECMWVTTEYRRGNQIRCIWSYRNYKKSSGLSTFDWNNQGVHHHRWSSCWVSTLPLCSHCWSIHPYCAS